MRYILILSITIFCCVSWDPHGAIAYDDVTTHPKISKNALEKSQTKLKSYFEDNLMLKKGIKTPILGKQIYKWVEQGAMMEDHPMCRASNHFHNPYLDWTVSGLTDTVPLVDWYCWATSPYPPDAIKSNVTWATGFDDRGYIDPSSDVAKVNEWDWESARMYYLAYLTGYDLEIGSNAIVANVQRRNHYLSYTFQAIGHVMHLLEDMAVPAHVRNDFSQGHTQYLPHHEATANFLKWFGNPFENYVRWKDKSAWFDAPPVEGNFSSFRLTDLWDINFLHFDTSPDQLSQISMSSLGLAEYTTMNFLSLGSMFETNDSDGSLVFPYPKPENCVVRLEKPKDVLTSLDRQYLGSWNGHPGDLVKHLAVVSYLKHYRDIYLPNISNEKLPLGFDDDCYEEYAQKLIPRAIGYSSELVDYFFRGKLAVTAMPYFRNNSLEWITLNIKNVTETQETLSVGNFFLLFRYTPVGGNPDGSDDVFVPSGQTPPCDILEYNNSLEMSFSPKRIIPIACWDSVTCTLVFHGKLGNESGAVVGKAFLPGKVLFNEEWDNGIDGNNNWQIDGDDDNWTSRQVLDGHLIMESTLCPEYDEDGRLNSLSMDLTADGSNGLLMTPTTSVQFIISNMTSTASDKNGANHSINLYFNNGYVIEYSGDGQFCDWTTNLISLKTDLDKIITDNIYDRFNSENIQISEPLYLEAIQFQQLAFWISDYSFHMDVDAIRLFDTQRE